MHTIYETFSIYLTKEEEEEKDSVSLLSQIQRNRTNRNRIFPRFCLRSALNPLSKTYSKWTQIKKLFEVHL